MTSNSRYKKHAAHAHASTNFRSETALPFKKHVEACRRPTRSAASRPTAGGHSGLGPPDQQRPALPRTSFSEAPAPFCWALLATLPLVLHGAAVSKAELPVFVDVTEQAGIRFKHGYGDHKLSNIVEGSGPGCAFFDYDGDGDLDVYFVNGCWLPEISDNRGRDLKGKLFNALYRNNGDGTFTDVTGEAHVEDAGYGVGASAADYDNDGDLDLYVLNYGPNVFYRNNGDGTFTDVTAQSGLGDRSWSLSAPWFDYDDDGDLDVYVANYLEYDAGKFRDYYPAAGYPGPLSYKAQPDRLYRNNGDGTFSDVTKEAGLWYPDGRAMSAAVGDLNMDGKLDIYVSNDAAPNCYWVNQGGGKFEEQALRWGLAFGEGGQGASSMGPVIGDVDRNGLLDVLIPDMGYGALLVNRGTFFVDVTSPSNIAVVCGQYTGWGGGLFDYDNDGYLDVFVANGNAHHEYTEEDVLLRNDGNGKFVDVADASGDYFRQKYVGRGAAFADYDNDGDVDVLVMNLNGPAKLLRNDGGNRNNWLSVAIKVRRPPFSPTTDPRQAPPTSSPAELARSAAADASGDREKMNLVDAIGARVTATVGGKQLIQEVAPVMGYLSQGDPRAHFGLATAQRAERLEIRWPSGGSTVVQNVKANQFLQVVQDGK